MGYFAHIERELRVLSCLVIGLSDLSSLVIVLSCLVIVLSSDGLVLSCPVLSFLSCHVGSCVILSCDCLVL